MDYNLQMKHKKATSDWRKKNKGNKLKEERMGVYQLIQSNSIDL